MRDLRTCSLPVVASIYAKNFSVCPSYLRIEILAAVKMRNDILLVVMTSILIKAYRSLEELTASICSVEDKAAQRKGMICARYIMCMPPLGINLNCLRLILLRLIWVQACFACNVIQY